MKTSNKNAVQQSIRNLETSLGIIKYLDECTDADSPDEMMEIIKQLIYNLKTKMLDESIHNECQRVSEKVMTMLKLITVDSPIKIVNSSYYGVLGKPFSKQNETITESENENICSSSFMFDDRLNYCNCKRNPFDVETIIEKLPEHLNEGDIVINLNEFFRNCIFDNLNARKENSKKLLSTIKAQLKNCNCLIFDGKTLDLPLSQIISLPEFNMGLFSDFKEYEINKIQFTLTSSDTNELKESADSIKKLISSVDRKYPKK